MKKLYQRAQWEYLKLWVSLKVQIYMFARTISRGFWLTMGDIFFALPAYRDAYYAYREKRWRNAQDAKAFAFWLAEGNLFSPRVIYVSLYLTAIILANLSVAAFGPGVAILNAFLFIGLDLTARDRLHDAWRGHNLLPKMAALIAAGSILSWLLNRNAGQIALASFLAFAAAASVDTLVYHQLGKYPRWLRINGSNIPSAAVDSLVFPTLAFGSFLWTIVLGQFLAKTAGGFIWSLILHWYDRRATIQRIKRIG